MSTDLPGTTSSSTPPVKGAASPETPAGQGEPVRAGRRLTLAGVKAGFKALEVRNYRLFWYGQLISLTGTWMQRTAQDWLVIELTHSPFAVGLVTVCQFLPIMLLTLVGGVIIDRLPKLPLIVVTQSVLFLQALVFTILVATGSIQIWHIYILAGVQGLAAAFDNPARQAFVPEMVGRKYLVNAVALNSMIFNGARVVGPAVAGLIIARVGMAPALGLNALSFIAVIGGLLMMDRRELAPSPRVTTGRVSQRLQEGLRYSWNTPRVRIIMIVVAAIGTFGYNFSVVIPLVAGFLLKTDAEGFGYLSAALGVGSLVAAFATAYTKQVTLRLLLTGSLAFSLLFGILAFSQSFALTAILLAALGYSGIIFTTSSNTLLQLVVPDELRGRVMSLFILLIAGTTPIGGLLIGSLSDHFGVSVALGVCAICCILGVATGFLYLWHSNNVASAPP
jgi:MFS family permease